MMKRFQCRTIFNTLVSKNVDFGCSLVVRSTFNSKLSVPTTYALSRDYSNHTFNTKLNSSPNRCYSQNNSTESFVKYEEMQEKATDKKVNVFSKFGSDVQFEMIRTFLAMDCVPTIEEWVELRQNILSSKGGKLKEDNVDGSILLHCMNHLDKTKSFIKFLNQRNKKITSQQISHLFKSFYLNKEKCTPEDLVFIKKMFGPFIKEKKITMATATVEKLVSGISLTDEWKKGVLLLEAAGMNDDISCLSPLIEAAISHGDMDFVFENLQKALKMIGSVPATLIDYWIQHINSRRKMDEFLEFLRESSTVITESTADLLVSQCRSHPNLYICTHTSIDARSSLCQHCHAPLQTLVLDPVEFERLKSAFLDRTLVGQDVFHKTTPRELEKYLTFLDRCQPYDIVFDALNVAHYGGSNHQPETLSRVVTHFLDRGASLLLFGRVHMLKWPKSVVRMLRERCQFFYVDNVSQDDPYLLYAAMHGGQNTKFISRDLMRSHLYLLKDRSLRATFLKWQQLNQIVILSVNRRRPTVRETPTYVQHAHCTGQTRHPQQWHVPYKEEVEELTFDHVYRPKATWLCLESPKNTNR